MRKITKKNSNARGKLGLFGRYTLCRALSIEGAWGWKILLDKNFLQLENPPLGIQSVFGNRVANGSGYSGLEEKYFLHSAE